MTLLHRYQLDLQQKKIVEDVAQQNAVYVLQEILTGLIQQQTDIKRKLLSALSLRSEPIKGAYLWGGVGRGKTYLMDLFYQSIPFKAKKRLHFHHFMMMTHQQLKIYQGSKDPLKEIARKWRAEFAVLCFDEFYVSDIADAMIMARFFEHLFHLGITLIATSNIQPENLYDNGLQRDKFLPTIDLIKKYTKVVHLDNGIDYRLLFLTNAQIYHYPLDENAHKNLMTYFNHLAPNKGEFNKVITIQDRKIKSLIAADSIIWFDFSEICESPRSQYDYIEVAKLYHTVIISGIRVMDEYKEDVAKRFIMMIDEFYDHHVALIISAQSNYDAIYTGTKLRFEFQRTISRLKEMTSKEYFSKEHI